MMRASTNRRTARPGAAAGSALAIGLVAGVLLGTALPRDSGAVRATGAQGAGQGVGAQQQPPAAGGQQAGQPTGTQQPPPAPDRQPGQAGAAQQPPTAAGQAGQAGAAPQPPTAAGQPGQAGAAQPPEGAQPVEGDETEADETAEEAPATLEPETFDGPIGMVINYIDSEGASDFESVMSQLLEGLAASEDAERVAQAAGWKLFKAQETGAEDQAVYIWLLDPVVEDADYSVPQLLYELFPAEVQQLYETYNGSFGLGQIWLNLDSLNGGDDESDP